MKKLIFISFFIVIYINSGFSQNYSFICGGVTIPDDYPKSTQCEYNSYAFINRYNKVINYIPGNTPVKTIMINFNIMQKDDGSGNFTNSTTDIQRLNNIFNWFSSTYENVASPSDPISGVVSLTDSKIRFELNGIYFYQNTAGWETYNPYTLLNIIENEDPSRLEQLNIFFTEGGSGWAHASLPSINNFDYNSFIVMLGVYNDGNTISDWASAGTLAHEMGHCLDLCHTYLGGGCPNSVADMVIDEEWFDDIFGLPYPGNAPHIANWYADAYDNTIPDGDKITNNVLGGNNTINYFSPKQIGKMLRKFIENNYMFIYEKLGVYYEYFLIDEFQDTSHVQYEILKPLINESLSQAQSDNVLLVGDIKQAIYRWRNGDWEIMKDTIDTDFHNSISRNNLTENWRSYPNIVNFNNSLFSELLSLKDLFNEENIVKLDYIKEIYIDPQKNRDVKQEIPNAKKDQFKDFQGYVKLYIAKDKNNKNTATNDVNSTSDDTSDSIESEEDDKVLQLVINDVNNLWEKGYKNIGILVRTNKEAVEVFKYILQNSKIQDLDFKIISDESISFANSDAVLWIVFTLYALQNGSNYARYMSEAFYDFIKTSNSVPYKSLMDNLENDNNFMAQNLYFKAEHLVNIIYKELDDKELNDKEFNNKEKVFCMHFLQLIKNYQREHNNNEVMFINWFLNNGVQQSLTITEEKNGVHISTIHKSKGLEYDAVIVPFINWTRNQNDYLWFKKPDICNSNIPAFLLKTSGDLANSQFADEYYMEKTKKYVDDLNLLYVALTRAKKVLIANIENQNIGKEIQKCVTNNFNIDGLGAIDTYKSINSNENFDIYEIGTLVNNTTYASDVSIENFQWAAKENVGIEIKIKKNYSLSSNEKIGFYNG